MDARADEVFRLAPAVQWPLRGLKAPKIELSAGISEIDPRQTDDLARRIEPNPPKRGEPETLDASGADSQATALLSVASDLIRAGKVSEGQRVLDVAKALLGSSSPARSTELSAVVIPIKRATQTK